MFTHGSRQHVWVQVFLVGLEAYAREILKMKLRYCNPGSGSSTRRGKVLSLRLRGCIS